MLLSYVLIIRIIFIIVINRIYENLKVSSKSDKCKCIFNVLNPCRIHVFQTS